MTKEFPNGLRQASKIVTSAERAFIPRFESEPRVQANGLGG